MKNDCTDFSRSTIIYLAGSRSAGKMIAQIFLACFFITTLQMNLSAQEDTGISAEQKIQKAQEHYTKGKELIQAQDYQAADEEFKKAQQLLEGTSPVKPSEAIAQEGESLPTPTETAAKVVTSTPAPVVNAAKAPSLSESASLVMKAKEFDQNGQLEQAVSLYLKAMELAPNNPELHYNLAVEYLKTYKYSLAEEEFKRVLDLNPKDKDAYYNLGVLYESYIIDKKQAISCYTQYLKFAPRAKDRDKVKGWIRQIKKEIK